LDNAERNRDEALRRILASLVDSIEALVTRQERELESIRGVETLASLSPGMESLYQNTAAVLDEVITGYRELQTVANLLENANGAQSRAIVALRGENGDRAIEEETQSLTLLRDARDEAREQQQQAERQEQQRQRDELRQAYREALEEQVTLRDEVATYRERELDRRERSQVRGLGERQETLRTRLEDLVDRTEALADAGVFLLAHRRVNAAANEIVLALRTGRVDDRIIRRQDSIVRILQSLIDALDEADRQQEQEDAFRDEQGGAGSGAGDGAGGEGEEENPLIAPVAQLKLLRAMQEEAAALTRWLNERGEPSPEDLHDVTELQRELANHAMEILMSIQQPELPGGAPDGPPGPPEFDAGGAP
ncbi:MAG: hypothetical protein KDA28_14030, partial [Phycisphaerales bacterium]|nr:hypothetical protein [Phycisphaerales bacterium]